MHSVCVKDNEFAKLALGNRTYSTERSRSDFYMQVKAALSELALQGEISPNAVSEMQFFLVPDFLSGNQNKVLIIKTIQKLFSAEPNYRDN